MPVEPRLVDAVPVRKIFLSLDNPRHVPVGTEPIAIARLCEKENVFQLARDIVTNGLNPLERFALVPGKNSGQGEQQTYVVAEGNRRICALKVLHDPELAPVSLRPSFERLKSQWKPIKNVTAAVFDDPEDVRLWLERIHSGPQGGVGRKDWIAEQKARFDGENKNRAAQALLDYAQKNSMITEAERAGKLTTVQRFMTNDVFRETIGIDQSDPNELNRTRPQEQFDQLLKQFMRDLVGKEKVHSRMNKPEIIRYSRPLSTLKGITTDRGEAEPLVPGLERKASKPRRPKRPDKVTHIASQSEIAKALENYGNQKLISLYHSLCSIEIEHHTPILAVGAWSFAETLTACAGRTEGSDFKAFLSKNRLKEFGVQGEWSPLRDALDRIQAFGNATKHHKVSAAFSGEQLNNDMTTLADVFLKCVEEASQKP